MAGERSWKSAGDPNQDWPVALHVVVSARAKEGIKAWASYTPTGPWKDLYESLKATYEGDTKRGDLESLIDVLEVMLLQLRRQNALGNDEKR